MDANRFLGALLDQGVTFFTGVPDSYLHGFADVLAASERARDVTAANEGNAVAIAAGHYLATGGVPLVYMQNSGLGNAVNPLASLACEGMLGVPMLLLVGWRGYPFGSDHAQHRLQGRSTPAILDALGIPYAVLPRDCGEWEGLAPELVARARRERIPVAVLAPKGVLSGEKRPYGEGPLPLTRERAIACVLDAAPADAVFSATTGRAARELYWLRESRGEGHGCDYLNVGAMGHASSVALGLALGAPGRRVVCLDGDAAAIMHMGSLAVEGSLAPANLLRVVLNNGMHESVGGVPSAGWEADLSGVAAACGYATVGCPVSTPEEVDGAVRSLCASGRAGFLDVRVRPGLRPGIPGLEVDPKAMRDALLRELAPSDNQPLEERN